MRKMYLEYTDEMRKYRREWAVSDKNGSLSFWVDGVPGGLFGGVEIHYREHTKPAYLTDSSRHEHCVFNDGPCWHDGSSLQAIKYWIPDVLPLGTEAIWAELMEAHKRDFPEVTA